MPGLRKEHFDNMRTKTLVGLILLCWVSLTMFWMAALAVLAAPLSQKGRVKLAFDPVPGNPKGTYHVIYGSTNPVHMVGTNKIFAPVKVMMTTTNVVVLSNLYTTTWYFFVEARYSNQVSLPSPVLQVWLLEPVKGMVVKEQYPSTYKIPAPVE